MSVGAETTGGRSLSGRTGGGIGLDDDDDDWDVRGATTSTAEYVPPSSGWASVSVETVGCCCWWWWWSEQEDDE